MVSWLYLDHLNLLPIYVFSMERILEYNIKLVVKEIETIDVEEIRVKRNEDGRSEIHMESVEVLFLSREISEKSFIVKSLLYFYDTLHDKATLK